MQKGKDFFFFLDLQVKSSVHIMLWLLIWDIRWSDWVMYCVKPISKTSACVLCINDEINSMYLLKDYSPVAPSALVRGTSD